MAREKPRKPPGQKDAGPSSAYSWRVSLLGALAILGLAFFSSWVGTREQSSPGQAGETPTVAQSARRPPRAPSPPAEPFPVRVATLQSWLVGRGGAVNPKVQAVEHALGDDAAEGTGRGLVAAQAIEAGERLVSVPQSELVQLANAAQDPLGQEVMSILVAERERCTSCSLADKECRRVCKILSEASSEAIEQIALSVWLVKEQRNASSHWRPWLDLLPTDWGSSVFILPDAQLKEALGGTDALEEARDRRASWRTAYEVLTRESANFREHVGSYEAMLAARLVVLSRVHGMELAGGKDGLVPFADLLNHDAAAPTRWGVDQEGGFYLEATGRIEPGAQITVSYGDDRSNVELLLHYGFVLPGNPAHAVTLALGLDGGRRDPMHGVRRNALLNMDAYRTYKFGALRGFAASGAPLVSEEQPSRRWGALSAEEQDTLILGEVLLYLRVAALDVDEVGAEGPEGVLQRALFEEQPDALAALRSFRSVRGPELESRAAARLQRTCDEALKGLGPERDAAALQQALEAMDDAQLCKDDADAPACVGSDEDLGAADLQHVASSAVTMITDERRLYTVIRAVAVAVQELAKAGAWPDGASGYELQVDCPACGRAASWYLAAWASLYKHDVAIADASRAASNA